MSYDSLHNKINELHLQLSRTVLSVKEINKLQIDLKSFVSIYDEKFRQVRDIHQKELRIEAMTALEKTSQLISIISEKLDVFNSFIKNEMDSTISKPNNDIRKNTTPQAHNLIFQPKVIILETLNYLTFSERQKLWSTCHSLRKDIYNSVLKGEHIFIDDSY